MRRLLPALVFAAVLLGGGCHRKALSTPRTHSFFASSLSRQVSYRIIVPAHLLTGPVHVLYLLHGAGGTDDEWPDRSQIAALLPDTVLVMPYGANSYFMNSATRPADRYEDFITRDLIADAERSLPSGPKSRAIAGVSMGGCAAITLALRHPDLFPFAAGLSPAIDVPERSFNWHRPFTSINLRGIFGPPGSQARQSEDPFLLARAIDPQRAPYLFLSTGEEPLADPISRFAALLHRRGFAYEFHKQPGAHAWSQWNSQLPALVHALQSRPPAASAPVK